MPDSDLSPEPQQTKGPKDSSSPHAASKRARAWVIGALVFVLGAVGLSYLGRSRPRPQDPGAALRQGLAAHRAGRIQEAAQHYRRVLEVQPGNKFAAFNLGVIDQRRGLPESAERYYRQALSADPNFQPALFNLAILQERSGAHQEAATLYRRLLELNPDHAAAHLNLGFLLFRHLGQQDEGRAQMQKAVELDPRLAARVPS